MKELKLNNYKSCKFNSDEYSHGSEICNRGKILRCHDGEWEDIGEDCKVELVKGYLNKNQTSIYLEKSETKPETSLLVPCIKFERYPKDNKKVYLVNGCNECKKVKIHWWSADKKEAWTTHELGADSVVLITKPYGNARMISESDCK